MQSRYPASALKTRQTAVRQPAPPCRLILQEDVDGKGRGVFAGGTFAAGEQVLEFHGEVRDVSEFADLTHALQIGPRSFLTASGGVDDFVNHSCAPNCGVRSVGGQTLLFALRPIREGEEITFDYSTTQMGGFWEMACCCGAATCRGHIGDFADLSPAEQRYYLTRNAVLGYLVRETTTEPASVKA